MIYIRQNQKMTKEHEFLKNFMSSDFFEKTYNYNAYNYTLIEEPFTGFGYTDLVCLIWNKSILNHWNEARNSLILNDIKILHHLYIEAKGKKIFEISSVLGFSDKSVNQSITRLDEACLLKVQKNGKIKLKPINEIFFLKEIVSIEAKLKNWRTAFNQSLNNTFFSSKSFTLFPEKCITENLLHTFENSKIGIISYENNYKIVKQPQKNNIPSTLNSWLFHEYIGRRYGVSHG